VPRRGAALREAARRACLGDACRGVEVLGPGRRHVDADRVEDAWDVREVVRLAVHRDLEQWALTQRIAETARPPVGRDETLEEVARVPGIARAVDQVVERPHEAGGEVVPHQHRAGHVDVRGPVAFEQVADVVREVEVARDDPDVEVEPRLLGELGCVPLDARHVGVGVRTEEPHPHYRRA
jgi:hypothetical protein